MRHFGFLWLLVMIPSASLADVETDRPAPRIGVSSTRIDLGQVLVGESRTVDLRLATLIPQSVLNIAAITLVGSADVRIDPSSGPVPCGSLAPSIDYGNACTVRVTFAPSAAGRASVEILIDSDDPEQPQLRVVVSGHGVESAVGSVLSSIDISVKSLGYPVISVGETLAQTVTLTNYGARSQVVSAALVGSTQFELERFSGENACGGTPDFVLEVGASCNLVVWFSPNLAGDHLGRLRLSVAGTSQVAGITLSGVALEADRNQLEGPQPLPDPVASGACQAQSISGNEWLAWFGLLVLVVWCFRLRWFVKRGSA